MYPAVRIFSALPPWQYLEGSAQVTVIPKRSAEDTTLSVPNAQGETVVVPIPKGTDVNIDVPGLHYNRTWQVIPSVFHSLSPEILAKYWEDPHTFKPDRFMKSDWNRDAFLPFSGGARACLGRRYALYSICSSRFADSGIG